MVRGFEKRLLFVWGVLSAITLASLWVSGFDGPQGLAPNAAITSGVIATALVKVRLILREFMEVRHAPVLLCRLTDAWLLFTGVALLGTYLVGMALTAE